VDAALPDLIVELGEHYVGAVDLVAGGSEVLADGAEVGTTVIAVFQESGGLRLIGVGAGAGVLAQLGPEVGVDGAGFDEADQAVGEVPGLGPGGQPDGQAAGGEVVDDGAAAVGFGNAVVNEALVQGKVGERTVPGQLVAGSGRGPYAVIGLIHGSGGVPGAGLGTSPICCCVLLINRLPRGRAADWLVLADG